MKTTQKIIVATLLFAQALVGMSCNNDDDTQDPIIGKWQLEQIFSDDVSDDISDCQKETVIEFKADGTYSLIDSVETSINASSLECVKTPISGTWENSGDDTYTFTTSDGSGTANVTFPDGKLRYSESGSLNHSIYIKID